MGSASCNKRRTNICVEGRGVSLIGGSPLRRRGVSSSTVFSDLLGDIGGGVMMLLRVRNQTEEFIAAY
jgi:hypothetical protein